jgi:hypothetical protein
MGNISADINVSGGPRRMSGECRASLKDNTAATMVRQAEDYFSCRASSQQGPGNRQSTIMAALGDYDFWTRPHSDVFPKSDLLGGDYTRSTNAEGDDIEQGEWRYADGRTKQTEINYDKGTYSETTTDSQGRILKAEFRDKDGNGGSYEAKYNDNGTLKQENITQQSGNQTQNETIYYDDQGNETGRRRETATDNGDGTETVETEYGSYVRYKSSTPAGEYPDSPCTQQMVDNLLAEVKGQKLVDQLQPYIYPKPDDAVGGTDDPCITQFNRAKTTQCKALYLCVDGALDDQCRCSGQNHPSTGLPAFYGTCQRMMCGEGTSCDPNTGSCSSGTGVATDFQPGVIPEGPVPGPKAFPSLEAAIYSNRARSLNFQRSLPSAPAAPGAGGARPPR